MRGASGAAVHDERVVEHAAFAFGSFRELLQKVGEVFVHELVPDAPILEGGLAAVAQGVVGVEARAVGKWSDLEPPPSMPSMCVMTRVVSVRKAWNMRS